MIGKHIGIYKHANVAMPSRDGIQNLSDGCLLVQCIMTYGFIPDAFLELISCNCPKGCRTFMCECKCANLQCIDLCKDQITNLSFQKKNVKIIYVL